MPTDTSADGDVLAALASGELEVEGRLVEASNVVLRVWACRDGLRIPAVYKPVRGERPLWDFPEGTLARREVAAYEMSRAMGLDCVPPTVLRDGPAGPGSVQRWVGPLAPETEADVLRIDPPSQVPRGFLPVLRAEDSVGAPLVVSHADRDDVRRIALLDLLLNNADRKGSALIDDGDRLWAIDNGLSFHVEEKLRTVLWGFAGSALLDVERRRLAGLPTALEGVLGRTLRGLLSTPEIAALRVRTATVLRAGRFPPVPAERTALPWPLW